ncbi:hypothetical protein [Aestuariibacter sp. A3R04]|uniref:hypothetical protein n=1 Tax=Aestuariibacter sp. A3R04 TaxID=2841571 RepID=UPI001C09EB0E|nr:hypothetical protein [Aestuariibacter sp. A3R04]MBU3020950.1 hypothetical protein [Aestuariibacter sp. A3R04]
MSQRLEGQLRVLLTCYSDKAPICGRFVVAALNDADSALPVSERQHMGMLLAIHPWETFLFE